MEIRQTKPGIGGYWLNHDSTLVRLHKDGGCGNPEKYAHLYPDKWKWFSSREEALASTGRQVRLCKICNL